MSREIFKVVKIINEYQIVVNAGKNQNLVHGDRLEIFEKGVEVIDTENNLNLGTLDYIKETVNVVNLYDKMSVCRKFERILKPGLMEIIDMATGFGSKPIEEPVKLKVDEEQMSGGFSDFDKHIKIGDLVRKAL